MIGKRIRIHGRVQGVFFRNWAIGEAERLGVKGSVRNRTDGSVEILAWGDAEAVQALAERCGEGPSSARVEQVDVEPAEGEAPEGFTREPTV